MSDQLRTLRLRIFRFDPSKDMEPIFENFNVPFEPGMQILQSLHYIQENIDGTLAVRWNCRAGRCGSCAMRINGRPLLACREDADKYTNEITIEPLGIFPVVKDLVTDISKAEEVYDQIPSFESNDTSREFWKIYPEDIMHIRELRRCIECYICLDVCHVLRDHKAKYIGPRFVVKIASLDKHPKDVLDRAPMLNDKGIGLCNLSRCCQNSCPEKIKITDDSIVFAKERVVDESYSVSSLFKRFFKK